MTLEDLQKKREKQRCFYTKLEIIDILKNVSLKVEVSELPQSGIENYLYLVPSLTQEGYYLQYVWEDGDWYFLGESEVDLTEYVTDPELENGLSRKQDKFLMITIEQGTNTYTASSTIADIITAYNAGKQVYVKIPTVGSDGIVIPLKEVYLGYISRVVFSGMVELTVHTVQGIHDNGNDYWGYELATLLPLLVFDDSPTANSNNPVKSKGIKSALDTKQATLVSGTNIKTINNTSLLSSGNIDLQTPLTFDNIPTANSNNPVKSGGVKTALDAKKGVVDVTSPATPDGTFTISLDNGDNIVVDFNHEHSQYQTTLVSGTSIKTINGATILTSGDLKLQPKTVTASTIPNGGMLPNVMYNLGTTDTVNITLAAGETGVVNEYMFTFTCQSSSCSVTLPASVVMPIDLNGNPVVMLMAANRKFECRIIDNCLTFNCWDL